MGTEKTTVESRVLEILRECPAAGKDDMFLFLLYYQRFGCFSVGELPFSEVMLNYRGYGLPCFETIRRARQRVQSCFPECARNGKEKTLEIQILIQGGEI